MWNSACRPKLIGIVSGRRSSPGSIMSSKNKKAVWISSFLFGFLVFVLSPAMASERLCDASFEDCRAPLVALIQKENVEIDIAFWFMDDWMITDALISKIQAGVKVRMLVDPRSQDSHSVIPPTFATMSPPVPMRQRTASGILHWKMALFAGQGVVEFSGANFSRAEMLAYTPYSNYVDEAIFFSDDPAIVNSFRTMYDNSWVDTVNFADYANTSGMTLIRSYATYPIESEVCAAVPDGCGLNFLPSSRWQDNYGTKVESAINAEKVKIDVDMFRITNAAVSNSMIAAFQRGVPIRMIVDMSEYINTARVWDRYNVDRMFMAGIPLKITNHLGQNHEKSVLVYGQGLAIWGSSNWTSPSFNSQQEHNYFSTSPVKPWYFQWFVNQFERRWNSPQEYQAFVPLGPWMPVNHGPANGTTGQSQNVTLSWDGGPWGQQYDIYLGTGAQPTLIASNFLARAGWARAGWARAGWARAGWDGAGWDGAGWDGAGQDGGDGQRWPVNLPLRGQRHPVQRHERGRDHEIREVAGKIAAQTLSGARGRRPATVAKRVIRRDALVATAELVRDDRHAVDVRVAAEDALDLARLDTEAADFDLAVSPPEDLQVLVLPPAPEIPGAVHPRSRSRSVRIRHEELGRQPRSAQVAARDAAAADVDLAGDPGGKRVQVLVENEDLREREGLTHRDRRTGIGGQQLLCHLGQGRGDGGLGKTVGVDQPGTGRPAQRHPAVSRVCLVPTRDREPERS